jgi:hypothetical protein
MNKLISIYTGLYLLLSIYPIDACDRCEDAMVEKLRQVEYKLMVNDEAEDMMSLLDIAYYIGMKQAYENCLNIYEVNH